MTQRTPDDLIEQATGEWAERWSLDVRRPARAAVALMRLHTVAMGRCNDVLDPFGLTLARYEALLDVHHAPDGERPFGALALRLEASPARVTKIVDALESSGLVERRPHATDRRAALAAITPMGRDVAEEATRALARVRFGLEPLAPTDLDGLVDLSRAVRGRPSATIPPD